MDGLPADTTDDVLCAWSLGSRTDTAPKSNALLRQRLNQTLAPTVVADRRAHSVDPAAQRRLGDYSPLPNPSDQIVPADHTFPVADQILQEIEDLRLDGHNKTIAAQLAPLFVENTVFKGVVHASPVSEIRTIIEDYLKVLNRTSRYRRRYAPRCETADEVRASDPRRVRDRNLTSWRAGPSTLVVPQECCTGKDCAPVRRSHGWYQPAGAPQLVVTSTLGTAVVPTTCLRRESKDGRMHVCIQDIWVVCLFIPPPM